MSDHTRFMAAIVVVFCIVAMLAVTATNTADTVQFIENPLIYSAPSPAHSYQDVDSEPPESSPFVYLPTLPVFPSLDLYGEVFSFDLYGTPTGPMVYDFEYLYKEQITCGNCGSGSYSANEFLI